MSTPDEFGPFRPGFGGAPPYLAGREREQGRLGQYIRAIAAGKAPGTALILYGPRGNGKTVLLDWLRREAASVGGVETAGFRPSEVRDADRLAAVLQPDSWWRRLLGGEVQIAGSSLKLGAARTPSSGEALAARVRKRPLVLLVDEAHTLDPGVGQILLNAAQEVAAAAPFLLVLAGTPDIERRLSAMGASFWSRAEQVRVGRLSEAAAAEALRRPLEEDGIVVPKDGLEILVRESQWYPYFLQVLGQAVWKAARAAPGPPRPVSPDLVAAALPEFERVRGQYYTQRFNELAARRLVPVGRTVAEAFRGRTRLDWGRVEAAVLQGLAERGGNDEFAAAFGALRDLGYLWPSEASLDWEPGIPSLMDFVRQHAPAG